MTIEKVQCHSAEHGIAESRKLLQLIAGRQFTAGAIPRAPFIDDQFYGMAGIRFAHNLPVSVDERLHALAFAQQLIPIDGVELGRVAFPLCPVLRCSPAEIPRVMMKRQAVNLAKLPAALAQDFLQELASPIP